MKQAKEHLEFYRDLEYLVNIDSGRDEPEGLRQICDFFLKGFRDLNWHTQVVSIGEHQLPCLVACNREAEQYDALFLGHMDTVFPKGTAVQRPYGEYGDYAYGPGVCDMKSGCLAILYAMKACPGDLLEKLNIAVILQPDEEVGSPDSRDLMCQYARKSRSCFVYEAAEGVQTGYHCVERKGIRRFNFTLHGRAGHAGDMLNIDAVSAIHELAYWIEKISALCNKETETSANIGLISGGTASNVVAEQASLQGEVRFTCEAEAERAAVLLEELRQHAEKRGIRVEQTLERYEAPMIPTPETLDFVRRMEARAAKRGAAFPVNKRGGLSAANIVSPFVPICIDGMGPVGEKAHSLDEKMSLQSVEECLRVTFDVLTELSVES